MYRPFEVIEEVESFYGKKISIQGKVAYIVGARISRNKQLSIYIEFENFRETIVSAKELFRIATTADNKPVGVSL